MSQDEATVDVRNVSVYPTVHDHDDNSYSPAIMVGGVCFVNNSHRNMDENAMSGHAAEDFDDLLEVICKYLEYKKGYKSE
jgi:hypothetical protein